ncbi:LptF/LptG family permease [Polycladidibacter hongkongensis]|uniref:LptF/LptG family permease n=1 Tax=Polycladidibacter hongkongensis TaxID=1647556 RepID=UPI001AD90AB9|nr:LptF/LptG family permease [Pseudovibrio hongkongensis]
MLKTIERYILRRSFAAFVITIAAMTGVVWATQALRQLDLVTSKGQTLLQFAYITSLALPFLVLIIAPFAMVIALIIVMNGMSRDSELIVVNAAGASRGLILRPIMVFSLLMSLLTGYLAISLSPSSLAQLREEITRVRVDLVANIVKPGRFISIEDELTFHIRNRSGDGVLEGLLLSDQREENTWFIYTADTGRIIEVSNRTLLVMFNGTIQRRTLDDDNISIVSFESYGFDLSSMIPEAQEPVFKSSERPTFELLDIAEDDAYGQKNRDRLFVEFHDRLSLPLYPLAFGLIIFLFLGTARTTRQDAGMAIFGAMASAILLRTLGFASTLVVSTLPEAYPLVYALPSAAILLCGWMIALNKRPSWIYALETLGISLSERLRKVLPKRKTGDLS